MGGGALPDEGGLYNQSAGMIEAFEIMAIAESEIEAMSK
jgi:hypothetical protein